MNGWMNGRKTYGKNLPPKIKLVGSLCHFITALIILSNALFHPDSGGSGVLVVSSLLDNFY
jgi:hypothetical protein